jgi:hypothetical protein
MFILDDIILAPLKGTVWLGKKIRDHVNEKMYNIPAIKEDLKFLEERFQAGQISKKEFEEREDLLLRRLEEAKIYEELRAQGKEK